MKYLFQYMCNSCRVKCSLSNTTNSYNGSLGSQVNIFICYHFQKYPWIIIWDIISFSFFVTFVFFLLFNFSFFSFLLLPFSSPHLSHSHSLPNGNPFSVSPVSSSFLIQETNLPPSSPVPPHSPAFFPHPILYFSS